MIEEFKKLTKWKKRTYALLVATAVILVWRGLWGLADLYIFPNNELHSYIASILIGVAILIATRQMVKELI